MLNLGCALELYQWTISAMKITIGKTLVMYTFSTFVCIHKCLFSLILGNENIFS